MLNCFTAFIPLRAHAGEDLDPSLEPLLLKQVFKQGGVNYIRMGDTTVEFSDQFRHVQDVGQGWCGGCDTFLARMTIRWSQATQAYKSPLLMYLTLFQQLKCRSRQCPKLNYRGLQ
jgi:hypothetical protein